MKKVFLLFIIYFFFISSCEYFTLMSQKEWAEKAGQEDDVIIYIGGWYDSDPTAAVLYMPCYWKIKNNTQELINLNPSGDNNSNVFSIFVVGNNVYTTGNYFNGVTARACYWINKQRYDLEVDNPGLASYGRSIKVDSDVIFTSGEDNGRGYFWINGKKSGLGNAVISKSNAIVIHQISSSKYDIYLGGINMVNQACYWHEGNIFDLPGNTPSEVNSICVFGNYIYSVGWINNGGNDQPALWKNNNLLILPSSPTIYGIAYSIFISNEDIYIAGANQSPIPCYWKNNKLYFLPTGINGVARSIFVYNDNIYIAGINDNDAYYWENGKLIRLNIPDNAQPSQAYAIFVKTNNDN